MLVSVNWRQSFTRSVSFLCVGLAAFVMSAAQAQNAASEQAKQLDIPQATLEAEASTQVTQDTVKIYLTAEYSGPEREKVDSQLTKTLSSTTDEAKGHSGIKVSTHNYNVWPTTDKKQEIVGWRGRAELLLESSDFEAVSQLAAQLADRMSIGRLAFSLSPQQRAKYEADLLEKAVAEFRDRAKALSQALGYPDYTIRQIQLNQAQMAYQPPTPRLMAAAVAEDAAVPLEAGTETVSVSITGSIYLLANTKTRQ